MPTLTIHLYNGVVDHVENLPVGYEYEVVNFKH